MFAAVVFTTFRDMLVFSQGCKQLRRHSVAMCFVLLHNWWLVPAAFYGCLFLATTDTANSNSLGSNPSARRHLQTFSLCLTILNNDGGKKRTNGGVQREPVGSVVPVCCDTKARSYFFVSPSTRQKGTGPFAKEQRVKEHHPVIFQTTVPPGAGTPRRHTDTTRVRARPSAHLAHPCSVRFHPRFLLLFPPSFPSHLFCLPPILLPFPFSPL